MRLEALAWGILLGGVAIAGRLGVEDVRVAEGMAQERREAARLPLSNPITSQVKDRRLCPEQWIEHSPPRETYCVQAAQR